MFIEVKATETVQAREHLTPEERRGVIQKAMDIAESKPEWRPGKSLELPFSKHGVNFRVALDYLPAGEYKAMIGLSEQVKSAWQPYSKQANDGQHKHKGLRQ